MKIVSVKQLIFSASLIVLNILLLVIIITQDKNYFLQKFVEHNVYVNFSEDQSGVQQKFYQIQDYLALKTNNLDQQFFSREDLSHLQDVRNIYLIIYFLTICLVGILIIGFIKTKKELIRALKLSVVIVMVIIILLLLFIIPNFNNFFLVFHQLLFPNGYWQLDPASSNLIKYFLNNIFFETFSLIVFWVLLLTLSEYIFSIIYAKVSIRWKKTPQQKS